MANEEMRERWAAGAAGWVENAELFDALYAPVTEAVLVGAGLRAEHRVLDVGCGSGTLLDAATEIGATTVGLDISPAMVEAARRRAPLATVVVADAQTDAGPGAPYDRVISRYGVMFFADPVAAFANLRAATAPGGRLSFACWRTAEENLPLTLGIDFLLDAMDPRPERPAPGAPGPTAFADRALVERILAGAGWEDVDVAAHDFACEYGYRGTDGVEERMAMVLGTTGGRMARAQLEPKLGAEGWAALLDEVREQIRAVKGDAESLSLPGANWLVTARNGG